MPRRHRTLTYNGLTGTIPPELSQLTALTVYLGLNSNFLSGTIPSSLGQLTGIAGLGLEVNHLSGTVPSELGLLTNMGTLCALLPWLLTDPHVHEALPATRRHPLPPSAPFAVRLSSTV